MPKAQYKPRQEKFELESVEVDEGEENAYVVLRQLNYGEKLRVRGLLARMHASGQAQPKPANRKDKRAAKKEEDGGEEAEMEMSFNLEGVYAFQFAQAIVEHNLQKDDGTLFNFKYRSDFRLLDPDVGTEIEDLIEKMNPQGNVPASTGGPDGAPLASESGEQSVPESTTPEKTPSLATSST